MNGLFNSTTLDMIIGLVFVYLLLAIMCTTINEWIAGLFKTRSGNLASAIRQLLDSQPDSTGDANGFLKLFYSHPLIGGMKTADAKTGGSHPAYLPARTFASVLIDLVTSHKPGSINFEDLEGGIHNLPDGDVKKALLALIQNAENDLSLAQKNIENWFDDTMDRVTGWYKRRTQVWTVLIALCLTVASNANTLRIVRIIREDAVVQAQLIEGAKNRVQAQEESTVDVKYENPNEPMKPSRVGPDKGGKSTPGISVGLVRSRS